MQLIHLNVQIVGIVIVETSAKVYKARYTVLKEGIPSASIPVKPIKYHVECYKGDKMVAFYTKNHLSEAQMESKSFVDG